MAEYGLVPSFKLPQGFKGVWDDITTTDFRPYRADAVVVFAGLLDHDVVLSFEERWVKALGPFTHRFIAGIHTSVGQSQMRKLRTQYREYATWQIEASMTPHQTEWTIGQLQDGGLESVALYAPQFHLARATMTLVKAAKDAGWYGEIHPYGWRPESSGKLALAGFDNQATHDELIAGEQTRWVNYTAKGDIASPETWGDFRPIT